MAKSASHEKAVLQMNRSGTEASGYFAARDGSPLWFEDSGGDGPILFYVYGLACSIQHWKYPKQYFSSPTQSPVKRRTVYMDFRGHGRSPTPRGQGPVTIRQLVSDIEALCEYRGIEGATFLGQSLGGTIALALADARPDLVRGLILLASPGRNPGPHFAFQPFSQLFWRSLILVNRMSPTAIRLIHTALVEALRSPVARVPFREIVRHGGFNSALAKTQDIEDYISTVFEVSPNVFFDLASDLASFDVERLTGEITNPTLLISGCKDLVIPFSEQKWLAEMVPHAQVAALEYGSHCPHFDDPSQVIKIIETFLAENEL